MKSTSVSGLEAGGKWAVNYPIRFHGVKFGAIVRGSCLLKIDGHRKVIQLNEGDCFLMTDARSYWFGSDPKLKGVSGVKLFQDVSDEIVSIGKKKEMLLVGGRLTLDPQNANLLKDILPPFIHVLQGSPEADVLRWTLSQMAQELRKKQQGQSLMVSHLGHILFVQVLRAYFSSGEKQGQGWLGAFSDHRILTALNVIHEKPAYRWTLNELAKEAGMSRTAFAVRFKSLVGNAPLDYLLRWRMRLAAQKIIVAGTKISEVAFSLGYESESAFSSAFKRVMGQAPKHYQSSNGPRKD